MPRRERSEDALSWTPNIDASRIGVVATDVVVTLTGPIPGYAEHVEAERTGPVEPGPAVVKIRPNRDVHRGAL